MSDRLAAAVAELVDALRQELNAEAQPGPDRLYSVADAADLLAVGRSKLYAELNAGRLRSVSIGDRRLVSSGAIADYIAAAQSPPRGAA